MNIGNLTAKCLRCRQNREYGNFRVIVLWMTVRNYSVVRARAARLFLTAW